MNATQFHPNKRIRFKCWIAAGDEKFYGPGPHHLLKEIHKEGSLSKAAGKMNLSYKKAWELVQRLNQHSKEPLVILKKGGAHGGGALVTAHALEIIAQYDELYAKMNELVEQQQELLKIME